MTTEGGVVVGRQQGGCRRTTTGGCDRRTTTGWKGRKRPFGAFFGLSRPNEDREGSERVPEAFSKGWESIPADVEGILGSF